MISSSMSASSSSAYSNPSSVSRPSVEADESFELCPREFADAGPFAAGTGVSAVLIEHSQTLAYLGLAIIFGFNGLTAYKLRKERRSQKLENFK